MRSFLSKLSLALAIFVLSLTAQGQVVNENDTLWGDLDDDAIADTAIYDREQAILICKLSTRKFVPVKSMALVEPGSDQSHISLKGNSLIYSENWMRAGYSCQFRYEKATGKMRLIGMDRYEFGNASNDGSGKSSVNLLTGNYIGEWNYFSERRMELVALPPMRRKMKIQPSYLQNFDGSQAMKYADQCAQWYGVARAAHIKAH